MILGSTGRQPPIPGTDGLLPVQVDQVPVNGVVIRSTSLVRAQLFHHPCPVPAGRLNRDTQAADNLGVLAPLDNQPEYFSLLGVRLVYGSSLMDFFDTLNCPQRFF